MPIGRGVGHRVPRAAMQADRVVKDLSISDDSKVHGVNPRPCCNPNFNSLAGGEPHRQAALVRLTGSGWTVGTMNVTAAHGTKPEGAYFTCDLGGGHVDTTIDRRLRSPDWDCHNTEAKDCCRRYSYQRACIHGHLLRDSPQDTSDFHGRRPHKGPTAQRDMWTPTDFLRWPAKHS